jgi:anti-sigma B factor antagonist
MTEFQQSAGILSIRITESRLDAAAAPAFKAALEANVTGSPRRVVVEMEAVQFLDSTGLGVLVSLMKLMAPNGGLAITGAQPAVRRLLQITQLDKVFRLFDDRQAAEAALRG